MTTSLATTMIANSWAQDKAWLTALLADVTAIRASVLLVTAKLDADAGVTDTNYAASCNPAALTAAA